MALVFGTLVFGHSSSGHSSSGVHAQPEGLDFDAQSRMYISNEGRKGDAMLYRFDPRY